MFFYSEVFAFSQGHNYGHLDAIIGSSVFWFKMVQVSSAMHQKYHQRRAGQMMMQLK
jgi:hypothetical protein